MIIFPKGHTINVQNVKKKEEVPFTNKQLQKNSKTKSKSNKRMSYS